MGDKIVDIFNSLREIKTYVKKLNYERRKGEAAQLKYKEAKNIYAQLSGEIDEVKVLIEKRELSEADILTIRSTIEEIKKVYREISEIEKQSTLVKAPTMSSFDIKVAANLLPVMNDSEDVTLKLIEATEFYESMLDDASKPTLVKFILKTRLSNSAKLRLKSNYNSVGALIGDIKKHLLTRQSDTALQAKLFSTKQGDKCIAEFGKELEEIFVNLTISQANGDAGAFEVLRPINEKAAIKRFASGLRNQKLSTIISSRNFEGLKDAIRSAQDEEISFQNDNHIFNISHRDRGNFRPTRTFNNRARNSGRWSRNNYPNNRGFYNTHFQQNNNSRGNYNQQRQRFLRSHRGRSFTRGNMRGSRVRGQQMHFAEDREISGCENSNSQNRQQELEFFRP